MKLLALIAVSVAFTLAAVAPDHGSSASQRAVVTMPDGTVVDVTDARPLAQNPREKKAAEGGRKSKPKR